MAIPILVRNFSPARPADRVRPGLTEEIPMIYESADCDLCRRRVDRAADATAFAFDLRHEKPRIIDLAGEQPWIGVRILCPACLDFFRAAAIARETRKG
jgi:hypothetical protein